MNTPSLAEKRTALAEALKRQAREGLRHWPLSRDQQAMWHVYLRDPGGFAYNVAMALRFGQGFQVDAMRQACADLTKRHALLRAVFMEVDAKPLQQIAPQRPLRFTVHDAQGLDEAALQTQVRAAYRRPFNLQHETPVRFDLFSRGPQETILLISLHHIVCDGWSMWLIVDELRQLYEAAVRGSQSSLPTLQHSFRDHIAAQDALLSGDRGLRMWDFWRKALAGATDDVALTTDRPRPRQRSFNGDSVELDLGPAVTARLLQQSRSLGSTPYVLLLAAYGVLLWRHTGNEDLLLGSPMAGRTSPTHAGIVGHFSNPVVLRLDLSGDPSFQKLLERVRHTTAGALEHQGFPFTELVRRLNIPHDPSRTPLTPVSFSMQKDHLGSGISSDHIAWSGVAMSLYPMPQQEGQNDLDLDLLQYPDRIAGSFKYNVDLFERGTVERLAQHFRTLLDAVLADPLQRLSALPMMDEAEYRRLLSQGFGPVAEVPWQVAAPQLFEQQTRRTPDALACSSEDGSNQLSYAELNHQANQLAHLLLSRGLTLQDRVGLYLERSPQYLVALLAVFKAGGTVVALDPSHPVVYTRRMLADAEPGWVLTQVALAAALNGAPVVCLDAPASESALAMAPDTDPLPRVNPDDLAQIAYTSGSTGEPKGVVVTHRQILNWLHALWARTPFEPGEVVAQRTNAGFVVSVKEMLAGLLSGVPQVIVHDETSKDLPAFINLLERHRVTRLNIVPSHLQALLRVLDRPQQLATLKHITTAGEMLTQALRAELRRKLPGVVLWNNYGCTELNDITYCAPHEQEAACDFVPIGRPIANTQVHVLDAQLKAVPIGVPGELCVESPAVGPGYWRRPDLTEERFIASPFTPGATLYRTGDIVRWRADGQLDYIGRRDFDIKIRGQRIDVRQVEAVLKGHPGVKEGVVHRHARSGDPQEGQLVAYYVTQAPAPSVEALRGHLSAQLPAFMVPSLYVALEALPRLPNGKLDRRSLPAPDDRLQAGEGAAPLEGTPAQLAQLWAGLLEIPAERIGAHDNFFSIGGDSLLTSTAIAKIYNTFGVELPMRTLFEAQTLQALAARIDAARGEAAEAAAPVDLAAEAALDPAIRPEPGSWIALEHARRIFLTGATGYVGGHLLHTLLEGTGAQIHCLVRPETVEHAMGRLRDAVARHGFDTAQFHRVKPILGALDRPGLDLSPAQFDELAHQMDAIVHCGASINLAQPYAQLKPVNVDGTREVIRLACTHRAKALHHLSTTVVFDAEAYFDGRTLLERDEPLETQGMDLGYPASKWVAERLVKQAGERGLPVTVYRLGAVVGSAATGIWRANDLAHSLMAAALASGEWCDIDRELYCVPVDHVCRAVLALGSDGSAQGCNFHLVAPSPLRSGQVFKWLKEMGRVRQRVDAAAWFGDQGHATAGQVPRLMTWPQLQAMQRRHAQAPCFDCAETRALLAARHIDVPVIDGQMVARWVGMEGNFDGAGVIRSKSG